MICKNVIGKWRVIMTFQYIETFHATFFTLLDGNLSTHGPHQKDAFFPLSQSNQTRERKSFHKLSILHAFFPSSIHGTKHSLRLNPTRFSLNFISSRFVMRKQVVRVVEVKHWWASSLMNHSSLPMASLRCL